MNADNADNANNAGNAGNAGNGNSNYGNLRDEILPEKKANCSTIQKDTSWPMT